MLVQTTLGFLLCGYVFCGLSEYPIDFYPKPGDHMCGYRLITKSDCGTGDIYKGTSNQKGQYDMNYCAAFCDTLSTCEDCTNNAKCVNFMVGFVTSQYTTCWPKSVVCDPGHTNYVFHNTLFQYAREIPAGVSHKPFNVTTSMESLYDGKMDTCISDEMYEHDKSKWSNVIKVANGGGPSTDISIQVQLHIPGVSSTQCLTLDILHNSRVSNCDRDFYQKCKPLGKSDYTDACDYKCLCEKHDCSLGLFATEKHRDIGVLKICEVCVFDDNV